MTKDPSDFSDLPRLVKVREEAIARAKANLAKASLAKASLAKVNDDPGHAGAGKPVTAPKAPEPDAAAKVPSFDDRREQLPRPAYDRSLRTSVLASLARALTTLGHDRQRNDGTALALLVQQDRSDAVGETFRAFVEDRNNRASVTAGEIHQLSEAPETLDQCVRTADQWLRDNGPPCWLRKAERWRYETVTEEQRAKLARFPGELDVTLNSDQPKGRASDLIGRLYAKERLRGIIARAKKIAEDGTPVVDAELPRRSIWP
jgi:hypothetical protein